MRKIVAATALSALVILGLPGSAEAALPYKFKNCTALNKVYKHGVGKKNAKDKTSGTPVTNFRKGNVLYKKITTHRPGLDRDKDGIACEKR